MDAVYVIGAGPLGLRVLETARACGLAVAATDRSPGAPGFLLADRWRVVDGTDVEGHLSFARSLRRRMHIVGIYCGAEFGARTVQRLSAELGLPAPSHAALERALDKPAQKRALLCAGVPTPPGETVRSLDELAARLRPGARHVLKPAGGSGSRGVRVVAPGDDLAAAFRASLDAVAGERALVLEPYREGRSIDANGCFLEGRFHPCGLLEKFVTPPPDCLPLGGYDPARLSPAERAGAYALLERACRALGLTEGPVKGDFLLGDEGFEVLEVAPRFHGDVTTSNTLPFGSCIDPVRFLFRWFRERRAAEEELHPARRSYATWRVVLLPPGRLRRRPAEPLLERHPGVTRLWWNPKLAEQVPRYGDTTRIPGYACACGARAAAAEAALRRLFAELALDVEPDPAHAAWYAGLGASLRAAGFAPAACGYAGATGGPGAADGSAAA